MARDQCDTWCQMMRLYGAGIGTLYLYIGTLKVPPYTYTLAHDVRLVPCTYTLVPCTYTLAHNVRLVPCTYTLVPCTYTLAHNIRLVPCTYTLAPYIYAYDLILLPCHMHNVTLVNYTLLSYPVPIAHCFVGLIPCPQHNLVRTL